VAYRLDPTLPVDEELRRVVEERLVDALEQLDCVRDGTHAEVQEAVHDLRRRCKELRALGRLLRPSLGSQFSVWNSLLRDAAGELSDIRDAHVLIDTLDLTRRDVSGSARVYMDDVREHHRVIGAKASHSLRRSDKRVRRIGRLLGKANRLVEAWNYPQSFAPLKRGLRATYERGRDNLGCIESRGHDDDWHEWRKSVKALWYQVRLIERAAPSVLGPLSKRLEELGELLGDEHDLSVLRSRLREDRRKGSRTHAKAAARVARSRQKELRARLLTLGGELYAESPGTFAKRMGRYWALPDRSA
jgi:CHAD domain-containing protein